MTKKMFKKGILFTLGLTLLAFALLALAILIFHDAQKSEEIITQLAVLDRAYDLDTSIQQSLRDIFNLHSGILINVTNDSISFEEELPNANVNLFANSMTTFKEMVESNFSYVNITINDVINQLPLTIMPYDITYKHINFGDNEIRVVPQQINFNGYSVFMRIDKNITSCNWNKQDGGFGFSVEVKDPDGDSCSNSMSVDPSFENEAIINLGEVVVEVKSNILNISVRNGTGINAIVKTKIQLGNTETAYVGYNSSIIIIDFNEFGIYKATRPKLS